MKSGKFFAFLLRDDLYLSFDMCPCIYFTPKITPIKLYIFLSPCVRSALVMIHLNKLNNPSDIKSYHLSAIDDTES